MRLFIAIEFEEISDYLKQLQGQIPEAKATFPKQFHLTLKFLGEVADDNVDKVKEKLKTVDFESFKLKLDEIGVFPNEKFIKVVWVGLEDGNKVNKLQQQIEAALERMFGKDNKFHPHITLARVKFIEEGKKEGFIDKLKKIEVEQKEIEIKNFKLIKSELTKQGHVYEDLEVFE